MLRLLYLPLSPFARKTRVAAIETGVHSRITLVHADIWNPDPQTEIDAPLGQVPVLLGGPDTLAGSTLICDYFDSLATDTKLIPTDPEARWRILAAHALADGVMVAAVAHTVERIRRPRELQWPQWLARQESKIVRALACLESSELCEDTPANLATITLGCALSYLDRRLPQLNWRASHPQLQRWLASFEQRPSMQMTRFPTE